MVAPLTSLGTATTAESQFFMLMEYFTDLQSDTSETGSNRDNATAIANMIHNRNTGSLTAQVAMLVDTTIGTDGTNEKVRELFYPMVNAPATP